MCAGRDTCERHRCEHCGSPVRSADLVTALLAARGAMRPAAVAEQLSIPREPRARRSAECSRLGLWRLMKSAAIGLRRQRRGNRRWPT